MELNHLKGLFQPGGSVTLCSLEQPRVTFLADGHSVGIHQCHSCIKGAVGTLVGALPQLRG